MVKKNLPDAPLVYSTDIGRVCPGCSQPVATCRCRELSSRSRGDGNVRISRSTKGRKGSGVSVISGLPLGTDELKELAKDLKQICGAGGTVKNGDIEIQSDKREVLLAELQRRGFKAKIAGS